MRGPAELDAIARRVIDANQYMVLGTRDPDGSPRLSPVYYTPARYAPLRLYLAHLESCEVHVPGGHPVHGRGVDTRQPADPTSA